MNSNIIESLRATFGAGAVMLPCKDKGCYLTGWPSFTLDSMNPAYLLNLRKAPQIGVLCGKNSGGVVCLDFDTNEALAAFTDAVSGKVETVRVKGKKGAKVFFSLPPESCGNKAKLKIGGENVGDFLSTGSQAIVCGIHHETKLPYEITGEAVMKSTLEQLHDWLAVAGIDLALTKIKGGDCGVECSVQGAGIGAGEEGSKNFSVSPPSTSGEIVLDSSPAFQIEQSIKEIERRLQIDALAGERLKQEAPDIAKLYAQHVEGKWMPGTGERNTFVIESAPFLIRRVAPAVAVKLGTLWFRMYRELFQASEQEHREKVALAVEGALLTYRNNLSNGEGAIYDQLDLQSQSVFRIARDLARSESRVLPPCFILSEEELGRRLGIHHEEARRIIQRLSKNVGLFTMEEKGLKRTPGAKPKATIWRWKLGLEPLQ